MKLSTSIISSQIPIDIRLQPGQADSHFPRPRPDQGHCRHIHPKQYHRARKYRPQDLERHTIQLGPELRRAHGKDADGESEPPPAHVESDLFFTHKVENGGYGED